MFALVPAYLGPTIDLLMVMWSFNEKKIKKDYDLNKNNNVV